jgi:hypothetical protein
MLEVLNKRKIALFDFHTIVREFFNPSTSHYSLFRGLEFFSPIGNGIFIDNLAVTHDLLSQGGWMLVV